jgi:hypothetical protein
VPDWGNFFVAEVSAAAALAGLLFVAVSINLGRILEFAQLPARAAEALVTMLSVVFVASCGLIPGQGIRAFGVEAIMTGLLVWVFATRQQIATWKNPHPQERRAWRVLTTQVPSLPYVIGGAILYSGAARGAYWLAAGGMLSLAGAVFNAWVLLVEIQR